ncbi:MAG: DUF4255 domain-containing protein [Anaerolineae bacterium]|jgi:hypothetical protein|nr:DUF4255 domain-containing protein [Anaerolineae bacterium]
MSGPFALAAVSAVLRRLITNGLGGVDLSIFGGAANTVTVQHPDLVQTGTNEPAQLNLFLYRVTPNPGLRNESLPVRDQKGDRLTNQPLALDLHYLLSAYGAEEFSSEALLGYGMQVLHEVPFLSRDYIRRTFPGGSGDAVEMALGQSGLAEQIEYLKISPETLSTEEMSKLWTAFQAKFRPSAGYLVTAVLIQANQPARTALPVLTQGEDDRGPRAIAELVPPYPTAKRLALPGNALAAELGAAAMVEGHSFAGESGDPASVEVAVLLTNDRWGLEAETPIPPADRDDLRVQFTVPNDPANLPAGLYRLAVRVNPTGKRDEARASNELPLLVAARITTPLPGNFPAGLVTLDVTPEVRPGQLVELIVGSTARPAQAITANASQLDFDLAGIQPGLYPVRLRVDNVEGVFIDASDKKRPKFDSQRTINIT